MPHHRRKAFKEQQNLSSMKEEAQTLRSRKAKTYPASLNGIPKQET